VFTITASVEIAARLRGGKGALGWLKVLPWRNPMMLTVAFSFVMLGFGGAGGLVNMSYQLNQSIHNTQWVTGCTMYHGPRGVSDARTPNLAGQYPPAIYKQLRDFQRGERNSATMSPLVANLSDQDMRDLAAYYAYLPRLHAYRTADAPAPQIVSQGPRCAISRPALPAMEM
jgi:cytochrome c553